MVYSLFHTWAKIHCFLSGIDVRINNTVRIDGRAAVYCCNHFSSFDNFAVYLLFQKPFNILGIEEIGKLPLYGPLFKRMHICFNRTKPKSKVRAMQQAMSRLEEGEPVIVAVEGGIKSLSPPELYQPFEDGAFIMAIRKQVPLVPFVFKTNHLILPEFPLRYVHRKPCQIEVLEAVETKGMSLKDIPALKEEVRIRMATALQGVEARKANLAERSAWNLISEFR